MKIKYFADTEPFISSSARQRFSKPKTWTRTRSWTWIVAATFARSRLNMRESALRSLRFLTSRYRPEALRAMIARENLRTPKQEQDSSTWGCNHPGVVRPGRRRRGFGQAAGEQDRKRVRRSVPRAPEMLILALLTDLTRSDPPSFGRTLDFTRRAGSFLMLSTPTGAILPLARKADYYQ
jgi:hypothetical protein